MDTIRRALGEDEISYFGFSYGSELGGTWATLFPDTVRAAVLDGAADPNAAELDGSLQQAAGFEATLATFLAQCSANPDCAVPQRRRRRGGVRPVDAEDRREAAADRARPPAAHPGRRPQGVGEAMYDEVLWPELEAGPRRRRAGRRLRPARPLRLVLLPASADGTWANSLEAFQTIHCMDSDERLTVEEEDATMPQFNEVAPRSCPGTAGDYFCTFFPESDDPRVEITGAGAGPIVVCGTTGDAATPLASTRNMAETLEDGRLIIVDADQHTCYSYGDPCANDLIDDYLINLNAPPEVTEC